MGRAEMAGSGEGDAIAPTPEATVSAAWSRRSRTVAVLLLAAVAFVLFLRLGAAPVHRSSEIRCAETAAQMERSGNYLVPYFEGQPRLHKPPLFYWLAAGVGALSDGVGSWEVRIPSALAALALFALTMAWGRSLGGDAQGLLSGVLLAGMVSFFTLGRRGDAEMLLALSASASLFVFDRIYFGGRRLYALWAVVIALAFLAKATTVFLLVGLPVVLTLIVQRSLRWLFRLPPLAAFGAALCAGFAWYAVVLLTVPGAWDLIYAEAVLPLGVRTGHESSMHFRGATVYVGWLIAASFPAALALPALVRRAIRTRFWSDAPRTRFVALALASTFVAFSLIPQKQRHYLAPLLPWTALLSADALLALGREVGPAARRWLTGYAVASGVLGLLVTAMLALYLAYVRGLPAWLWLPTAVLPAAGALPLLRRPSRQPGWRIAAGFCCVALALFAVTNASIDVWRVRFDKRATATMDAVDQARWSRVFDQHPTLRILFRAGAWEPAERAAGVEPQAPRS